MSNQPKRSRPSSAKEGDLCVWWNHHFGEEGLYYPVANLKEAKEKLMYLQERDLRPSSGVVANAGGLLVFENGEWGEWYNEEGEDIDEVMGVYA